MSAVQPVEAIDLRFAERQCVALARREAGNFFWGFSMLPRERMVAMSAFYSFARQVDDEVDLAPADSAAARLAVHRQRLRDCLDGRGRDPVMVVLGRAVERYQIPASDLEQVIEGAELDLKRNRYQTWEQLNGYCELVASSVGRVCVRIFGHRDRLALEYAHQLGLAMQITNILRDVGEDLGRGRIYIPLEDMDACGVAEEALLALRPGDGWSELIHLEARRAERLFEIGLRVTGYIPYRAAVCVRTMAGIYRTLLGRIEADPYLPLTARARLDLRGKLAVLMRSWLQPA